MIDDLQGQLFAVAMRNIRAQWKNQKGMKSFIGLAQLELWRLQGEYKYQKAEITARTMEQKLAEAAQNLQLKITTSLGYTRFPRFSGISLSISHENRLYGEIFIGPADEWDKVLFLPPEGIYHQHQDNPYTKKHRRNWQTVEQFDFGKFITYVKENIDRPPIEYPDDDGDDLPF